MTPPARDPARDTGHDTGHDTGSLPATMKAMVTMGHGGLDQLVLHSDWPRPDPAPGEVLVRVRACGLNNTDVNTRIGWYSQPVARSSDTDGDPAPPAKTDGDPAPSWGGAPIRFPRIQGADACGHIVAVGAGVDPSRLGERIITDNWLRDPADPLDINKTAYFGSECDGGFAEYTVMPATNAMTVHSDYSDAELATFSCSYATAEGMLTRASVTASDTVLVRGASGGVGGALVQLAKRRGARVIAMAAEAKHADVAALGPDLILPRAPADLRAALGAEKITVLADVVAGDDWAQHVEMLERGGRYVCSGAIAGPLVTLDLRTFYLRDLSFFGSTVTDRSVIANLVRYIEAGEIRPALAATYPLEKLAEAQTAFVAKKHSGNIVVIP